MKWYGPHTYPHKRTLGRYIIISIFKHAHDELRARVEHEEAQAQQHRGPDQKELRHRDRVLRFRVLYCLCVWVFFWGGGVRKRVSERPGGSVYAQAAHHNYT